jgi:hypothetical protein
MPRGQRASGCYQKINVFELVGYVDNDWCSNIDDHKSTLGYTFYMRDTTFTWLSKKQSIITLSTYEVEYVVNHGVNHAI